MPMVQDLYLNIFLQVLSSHLQNLISVSFIKSEQFFIPPIYNIQFYLNYLQFKLLEISTLRVNLKLNLMKTKFKYFLLYSMSCIGVLSLLSSVSGNISNKQQNEVGTYQIAVSSDQNALFRLNTSTGKIVRIKKSNIKKIDLN